MKKLNYYTATKTFSFLCISKAKARTLCVWFLSATLTLSAHFAEAHWRYGGGLGFGGSGIEKEVPFESGTTVAQKSEGFGMMHFFIEDTWSPHWLYGLEHSRGFRLGPFSSGVGFTSAVFKWHYMGTVPDIRPLSDTTTLFEKRWSFYTGFSAGLASGTIRREGDQIPSVSSSGVHFGLKNGVDYLLRKNLGMRIEMSFSTTFFQATTLPANMREFSLWYGLFVPL